MINFKTFSNDDQNFLKTFPPVACYENNNYVLKLIKSTKVMFKNIENRVFHYQKPITYIRMYLMIYDQIEYKFSGLAFHSFKRFFHIIMSIEYKINVREK